MSGQTDRAVYHDVLRDTGVKLILVNFRKFSVEGTSPTSGNKDIEEQKEVDRGCEEIADYFVHVDPGKLQEAPRRLADRIMQAMTDYLINHNEANAEPTAGVAVAAQTFESPQAHSYEV